MTNKILVLKGGRIVLENEILKQDLVISNGKIIELTNNHQGDYDEIIDCSGKYILPGAIDVHVHFRTPGSEEKEDWITGSRAAAKGGVTTVLDMPNNNPAIISEETLDLKREIVSKKSIVNYGFNFGATIDNIDEIKRVFGKKGVSAVKVYMGATTGSLLMDDMSVLENLLNEGIFILVHAECNCLMESNKKKYIDHLNEVSVHSKIRNQEVAFQSMKKAVDLAVKTGGRLHVCHMSTKVEADYLRQIKAQLNDEQKKKITCEACPHHLYFNVSDYSKMGAYIQMNPALHESYDVKALWEGISDGTVDMIATDHAPHLKSEKELPYGQAPSGVPGVETVVPFLLNAVHENKIELTDISRLMGSAPANVFKLKGKGAIKEGFDADLIIVDMEIEKEVKNEEQETKCQWSPFHGKIFKGLPIMTFVNGNLVYDNGRFNLNFRGKEIVVE